MRKTIIPFICFLLLGAGVSAQVPAKPFSLYAGGGVSVPSADRTFKDFYHPGYHGFAGVGFSTMPMIQLVGKVEFHNFSSKFSLIPDLDGGEKKILMFGVDARLAPSMPMMPLKPFFLVGAGLGKITNKDFTSPVTLAGTDLTDLAELNAGRPDESKFYYNIGVGLELFSNPAFSLFVQGKYVSIASDNTSTQFVPISLGLKF